MKSKIGIPFVLVFLCFQQAIQAQMLNKKIQKSVVEIGNTFPEISSNRLMQLDQISFLVFKKLEEGNKVDLFFLDHSNKEVSQLAMVWLQTGMIYYGHSDMFNIQSAGFSSKIKSLLKLVNLKDYGFGVKNIRGENPISYKVDFGSGNWIVYPKTIQSIKQNNETAVKIYLEKDASYKIQEKKIELLFSDTTSIPREMLYMATRINNLIQTKK